MTMTQGWWVSKGNVRTPSTDNMHQITRELTRLVILCGQARSHCTLLCAHIQCGSNKYWGCSVAARCMSPGSPLGCQHWDELWWCGRQEGGGSTRPAPLMTCMSARASHRLQSMLAARFHATPHNAIFHHKYYHLVYQNGVA